MKFLLLFVLITVKITGPVFSAEIGSSTKSKSKKYSYGLITPGYGIVTEDDLAYDDSHREIHPYNPNEYSTSLHWQCFPVKDVTPKYKTWRGNNGMGAWDVIVTLCDLEIIVHHEKELQIYGDRRAHPVDYCQEFITEWRKLTKDQDIVCLNGDGGNYSEDKVNGKYKYWTWEKFKTKTGCFSYFSGQCNTSGCSKKKYLQ